MLSAEQSFPGPEHRARVVPALQEAFAKQLVAVKPSESLAEAVTWHKNELATWRKITSEGKIELTE